MDIKHLRCWSRKGSDLKIWQLDPLQQCPLAYMAKLLEPVGHAFLPGQSLTVSLELTSSKSPSHAGFYTLKMLQQRNSLRLALSYNFSGFYNASPESYANYSYWTGPDIECYGGRGSDFG